MTETWRQWRRRDLVALALAGLFLIAIMLESVSDRRFRPHEIESPPLLIQERVSEPVSNRNELRDVVVITERPLFVETRRPVELPAAASPSPQADAPQEPLTLMATVLSEGSQIAIIQTQRGNRIQKLHVGDVLDGWTLVEVQPSLVTLQRGSASRTLDLVVKPGEAQKIPPAEEQVEESR